MVTIRFRRLALIAYLLFLVPIAIFFFGWLKWYYAVGSTLILGIGFIHLYRSDYLADKTSLRLPVGHFVGIVCLLGLFVLFSGNCGFGASMYDIAWRTVFLTDLINNPWPVVYSQGYALAYYFAFWLLPALIGKMLGLGAAYVTMWFYETGILLTSALLFAYLLKADRPAVFWLAALGLILFSGLNVLGSAIMQVIGKNYYGFGFNGNEGYCDYFFIGEATNFYYRSNVDVIEEIYNQMLFLVAVPLMLQNRKPRSFVFIALILVPFSPWGCVGLIPLMLALGIIELVRKVKADGGAAGAKWALREIFSVPNILALVAIGVVFGTFFLASKHFSGNANSTGVFMSAVDLERAGSWSQAHGSFGILTISKLPIGVWFAYCVFCLCEFGIFAIFIGRKYRRDPFFWVLIVWLLMCPFIWVGTVDGRDFCMNGSLAALCCLMFYIMRYIREEMMRDQTVPSTATVAHGKRVRVWNRLFIVVLAVAIASPVMQMCYQARILIDNHTMHYISTSTALTTFDGAELSDVSNFVCDEPGDTFFFTVLSR